MASHISKIIVISTVILFLTVTMHANAEKDRQDYDLDNDGLIEINDLADLNEIRNNLDGSSLYGSSTGCPNTKNGCIGFELSTDLDFDTNADGMMNTDDDYWNKGSDVTDVGEEAGWISIGDSNARFSSVFEGNGYVIRNLFINRPSLNFQGLFGYTKDAIIRNVGLTGNLMYVHGKKGVGSLVGKAYNTKIRNVFNMGIVKGDDGDVGGIVGELLSSRIDNSFNTGSVLGGIFVGGLAGKVGADYSSQIPSFIKNGFNTGSINESLESPSGNIVGSIEASSKIINSYRVMNVSGENINGDRLKSNDHIGFPLEALKCPIRANTNSSKSKCVSKYFRLEESDGPIMLFENWNNAKQDGKQLWNFGTATQLPALVINGRVFRDSDFDGSLDFVDRWPQNPAASKDSDDDGYPDNWSHVCDTFCVDKSGLQLDQFPKNASAWQDDDLDGLPDRWPKNCDKRCQKESSLTLDKHLYDSDNDGINNKIDIDDNNDGKKDIDADSDGLIEIDSLAKLDAIRYQLDGEGLKIKNDVTIDRSGCPSVIHLGILMQRCHGYELTTDLDFDTNQDDLMNSDDEYWSNRSGWDGIGNSSNPFSATFEGNGYLVRNLFISRGDHQGLFGYTDKAIIRNIGLTGPLMHVRGGHYVGSLIGEARLTTILNVFNTGRVTGYSFDVGGVVGVLSDSSLINSFNTGRIKAETQVGGLVGKINSSKLEVAVVRNGYSTGWISSSDINHSGGYLGGLISHYEVNSNLLLENIYWATDSSRQKTSSLYSHENSYVGLPLKTIQCSIQANTKTKNNKCINKVVSLDNLFIPEVMFDDWDKTTQGDVSVWDFGTEEQLPALVINGKTYRDSDGDGTLDPEDAWPLNSAASVDVDSDGYPDVWDLSCDATCIKNSGLKLDQFPKYPEAWLDNDLDSQPDSWAVGCDSICQNNSNLVLDAYLDDTDNDGINNKADNDDNNDGNIDVDADSDGLIDIHNLSELNAIRNQLDGFGLRLNDDLDTAGCPTTLYQGILERRCDGYELVNNLDFDTNQDSVIDEDDTYWNRGNGWRSIGYWKKPFTAVFEGNGFVIRNLFISSPNSVEVGLFSATKNAYIRNIGLTGPLMSVHGNEDVGALIGVANNTKIEGVFNTGSVQAHRRYFSAAGGIVGRLELSDLLNSFNTGSISGNGRIGGVVGYMSSSNILNSLNLGNVTGKDAVGGLVGYFYSGSIRNILNTGMVISDGTDDGLVGGGECCSPSIVNSYWAIDTSGQVDRYDDSRTSNDVGLPLSALKCAVKANTDSNNSTCVPSDGKKESSDDRIVLFNGWDQVTHNGQALWDFGTKNQLPALVLNGHAYRDTDEDGLIDLSEKNLSESYKSHLNTWLVSGFIFLLLMVIILILYRKIKYEFN